VDEAHCAQFPDLPFIDGRWTLEAEVELIEGLQIRRGRQLQTGLEIAFSPELTQFP